MLIGWSKLGFFLCFLCFQIKHDSLFGYGELILEGLEEFKEAGLPDFDGYDVAGVSELFVVVTQNLGDDAAELGEEGVYCSAIKSFS